MIAGPRITASTMIPGSVITGWNHGPEGRPHDSNPLSLAISVTTTGSSLTSSAPSLILEETGYFWKAVSGGRENSNHTHSLFFSNLSPNVLPLLSVYSSIISLCSQGAESETHYSDFHRFLELFPCSSSATTEHPFTAGFTKNGYKD